jgi:hypothetical protein|tara:strand:+ start:475 stop:738 length:264 start_codon:yes stop_codon:yes gene_type:complete
MEIKNKKMKVGDLVRIHPEKEGYTTADVIVWRLHGVDKNKAIGIVIEVIPSRYTVGVSMCKVVFNSNSNSVYDIAMNRLQLVNRGSK